MGRERAISILVALGLHAAAIALAMAMALEMPEQAVDREITGRVEVSYDVDADGVVTSVEADGPFLLARSVRRWLEGCLFEPSIQGGRRTAAHVKQAFVFRIR